MTKSRITITIDGELIKRIDDTIDGLRIRSRSHAIEYLLSEKLKRKKGPKAFILCGGEGTRLRPLTIYVPKPMLPLGYKPILEHHIEYLKGFGITDIILGVGYLREQVMKYFHDGASLGVNITYSIEEEPLGTGGAIKNAQKYLDSNFLVINGDVLFRDLDLAALQEFHQTTGAIGTIVLTPVKDVSRFGVADLEGKRIKKFVEKPKRSTSNLINAGIYVLGREIFDYMEDGKKISLEREIFPILAKEEKLFGYKHTGYWGDLGLPEDYQRIQRDFLSGKLGGTLPK